MSTRKRSPAATGPRAAPPPSPAADLSPLAAAIAVAAALFFPSLVRLRLLGLPLERDEGEYAYAGQLILQGIPPYELVYNMKFPGIYAAFAALMGIFGQTVAGIRVGLLAVTTITTVLMYFLGARLFGRTAGAVTAAVFAVLSLAPEAFGLHAHATHFISPFAAGAMILLAKELTPRRLFCAGALLALGVLMKQPAIFFAAIAFVYVFVTTKQRARDLGMLAAGGAAVAAIAAGALAAAGVFDRFWFWTIAYAREYVTSIPLAEGLGYLGRNLGGIIGYAPAIWLVAAAGIVFLLQRGESREQLFVFGFLVAALLATTPGFYFRHHYFIVVFPAVALLAGAAVALAPRTLPRHSAPIAAIAAVVLTIATGWPRLMGASEEAITRQLFGLNPFPESVKIAEYIREQSRPGERVVVLGSEPQIYFYANRRSATGYIYAYPLMEPQRFAGQMQDEMIRQIEAAKPKFLVFVSTPTSWLRQPDSDVRLLEWFERESDAGRWTLDGVVNISEPQSEYVWGEAARTYRPRTENFVLIYRRSN